MKSKMEVTAIQFKKMEDPLGRSTKRSIFAM